MSRGGRRTGSRIGVRERLSGTAGVLVGLDFDGTLAPIAEDPDAPTVTPACRSAVEWLAAHPRATVAVVSGRAVADLRDRVRVPGVVYAGNHGLGLQRDGQVEVHPEAADRRPALERALERIASQLTDVPGWEIEDKGLTATVHVRRTPAGRTDEVRSAVEAAAGEAAGGLRVSTGKEVFEVRPDVEWDKGATMRHLASGTPDAWGTVYVGDDTTDEDAFRAVRPGGVGVLVGERERTAATHRLPDQGAVAPFIEWLARSVLGRPNGGSTR